MSGDALPDLLRAVRLRGAVFYYVEGDPPWVAEAPHVREIIPGTEEAAFSRAFKRVAGVSPGAWRKGRRENPQIVKV